MGRGSSTFVLPENEYSETDEKRRKLQKLIHNEASADEISDDLCLDIFYLEYPKTLWGWAS